MFYYIWEKIRDWVWKSIYSSVTVRACKLLISPDKITHDKVKVIDSGPNSEESHIIQRHNPHYMDKLFQYTTGWIKKKTLDITSSNIIKYLLYAPISYGLYRYGVYWVVYKGLERIGYFIYYQIELNRKYLYRI